MRRIGAQALREHRDADGIDSGHVAHHPVGDHCDDAQVAGHPDEHVTDHRRLGVAVGGQHQHVARLGVGQRRIGGQVVAAACAHGVGRTTERSGLRDRPHERRQGAALAVGVDQEARAGLRELLHERSIATWRVAADAEDWVALGHRGSPER